MEPKKFFHHIYEQETATSDADLITHGSTRTPKFWDSVGKRGGDVMRSVAGDWLLQGTNQKRVYWTEIKRQKKSYTRCKQIKTNKETT